MEIVVPPKEMDFLSGTLTKAERARRQGNTEVVYEQYSNLAKHFLAKKDVKTGIYFYEKCLEIARLTSVRSGIKKNRLS